MIRLLAFHGRHLPDSPGADNRDPEVLRRRLRFGGRLDPLRFLPLFDIVRNDSEIPDEWAIPVLQGIADRLESGTEVAAPEPLPAGSLAGQPSDAELRARFRHLLREWPPLRDDPRATARTLRVCIGPGGEPPTDLVPVMLALAAHPNPAVPDGPADDAGGVRGRTADAAVRLSARIRTAGAESPPLLESLLTRLAADRHPAVVRTLVSALPELADEKPEAAWRLFRIASRRGLAPMANPAERFLRARMAHEWPEVRAALERFRRESVALDAAAWGRAIARAVEAGRFSPKRLPEALGVLPAPETGRTILEFLHSRSLEPGSEAGANPRVARRDAALLAMAGDSETPPPLADRLTEIFRERAERAGQPLDAVLRMAYKLVNLLDRTAAPGSRPDFFLGLDALARRAPRAAGRVAEELLAHETAGGAVLSPAERDHAARIARRAGDDAPCRGADSRP